MTTEELLKQVRKIEIKAKGLSNQVFAGSYHSAFKGRGMSFSEVRSYNYGDDVRNIDWNVTARFDEPYVKVFEEERELTVMLLVDISKSTYFGTYGSFKSKMMALISAVLSYSAIQNNDKVGVLFFSDKVEMYIPPKKGKGHILRIIRELVNIEPKDNGTNLTVAMQYFNNLVKRRSVAFVLSDFITDDNYEDALKIVRKKHDIIGLHIYDKFEKEMPNLGLTQFVDAEHNIMKWIDTSSKEERRKYTDFFEQNLQRNKKTFIKNKADFISLGTEENYINALLQLFKRRGSRR